MLGFKINLNFPQTHFRWEGEFDAIYFIQSLNKLPEGTVLPQTILSNINHCTQLSDHNDFGLLLTRDWFRSMTSKWEVVRPIISPLSHPIATKVFRKSKLSVDIAVRLKKNCSHLFLQNYIIKSMYCNLLC